ncbi:hypothetical protein QR680_001205 [Steinernema hermaphroditum]|uniref:Uncharacterized protein n=1 Tax=Steinernema hermaphroditum TaxID=289476 RepID=A0AA39GXC2_9BILA|nr:hypothetical protein QR680_001205 [Steinernema hermaphroditum]
MLFKLFFLSLLFCAGNFEEVPNEESDLCSNGNRPFQFENGTALQCADDNDENCGPPFECDRSTKYCCPRMMISEPILNFTYFESEDDHEKFCGVEGRLVKENGSRLVNCELDSECLPPSVCHSSGFCCLIALHQEPPPVGCPMGTRPLRTANGTELSCNPNIADSCPGGAICHEDSLDGFRRCCGRDPGEGCPSGSRVVKNANGKPTLCSPGSYEHGCKNMAICQWSFLIDRYQCCEPDNGCAAMQSPLKDSKGEVIPCSKSAPCPNGGTCRFNFWTAGYQCCALNTIDLCPAGEVPFLIESSGEVYTCSATDPCPDGYFCSNGNVCCGRPGSCPAGKSIVADANGRISVCSIRASATCPGGSTCEASSAVGQRLCCSQNVYSCPAPGLPYPSASSPQQCSPFDPYSCPLPSQCLPSNVPGLNICCNDGQQHNNLCPAGWKANDFSVQYCNPQITASCPGFASCLRSPIAQQFVCCVPGYDDDTVGEISCANRLAKAERRAGRVRVCRSRNDRCSEGYSCQPGGPLSGGKMLCCSAALASLDDAPPFRCPHPSQIPVTRPENPSENVFCEYPGQKGVCPIDAACQSAANSAGLMICCYGSPNIPTCPFPRTPQPSPVGYVPCDMMRPNECWSGYTCVRSASGYRSSLCCSLKEVPNPTCPNQQSLSFESGRPQYCNPIIPDNCPDDYICVNALGQNDVFVCCSSPSATICPRDYSPSRDNYGNVMFCSFGDRSQCPGDSSCLESQNHPNRFICCKSTAVPRACPNGQDGLPDLHGGIETCTGPGQSCSRPGYTCQLSPAMSSWICCGHDQPMALCADGRETYYQISGTTYECNPLTFGDCPVKYECAYSNVRGISVCCKQAIPTIVPTIVPPVALTCPRGWNPYQSEQGTLEYCQSVMDPNCPNGFSCVQSNQLGTFICCRIASSPQCPAGAQALYVNNQPRTCTKSGPQRCPPYYMCIKSTMATIHICCSVGPNWDDEPKCFDGSQPLSTGSIIRQCSIIGVSGECPAGSVCSRSTRPNYNVCCIPQISSAIRKTERSNNVCGSIGVALKQEGQPVECSSDPSICSDPFQCQPSLTNTNMYCCQEARCLLAPPLREPNRCYTDQDCVAGTTCQRSENVPGISLCCVPRFSHSLTSSVPSHENVEPARCVRRATQMSTEGGVQCASSMDCDAGFECSSQTTSNESLCCETISQVTSECPDNRSPFRSPSTDDLFFCDKTDFACPEGFVCKRAREPLQERHICCSPIAFCRFSDTPLIDAFTNQAKRCFRDHHCGDASFQCVESSVKGVTVCCRREGIAEANRWVVQDG